MAYDNERVASAIKAYLVTNLPAKLAAVQVSWAATDPVTLPAVVTWFLGYKPTLLEMDASAFPFLSVMAPAREAREDKAQWGYQGNLVHAFVDFAVPAADEATANKIAHRYAEAIIQALQAQASFEEYYQVNYEPPVSMISFTRHHKELANSDAFNSDDEYFLSVNSIAVDLVG